MQNFVHKLSPADQVISFCSPEITHLFSYKLKLMKMRLRFTCFSWGKFALKVLSRVKKIAFPNSDGECRKCNCCMKVNMNLCKEGTLPLGGSPHYHLGNPHRSLKAENPARGKYDWS